MAFTSKPPELRQRPLVTYNEALPVACQCGVEQFTRQQPAGIRQNKKSDFELAPLGFVDCKGVRQLKGISCLLTKFPFTEAVLAPELTGKLHFKFPWQPLEFFRFVLPDDDPKIAIGNV